MRFHRLKYCLTLLTYLVVSLQAYADVAVSVDAIPGFDGYFRAREWVPVTLSVANLAGRFEGEVTVSLRWGERFSRSATVVSYRQQLSLPGGAGELIPFVLPLNTQALPITITFTSKTGETEVHETTLRSRPVRGGLIVGLSRRPDLDFLLGSATVAYPLPGYLPVTERAYDGVDAVVLHDVNLTTVDTERISAVERWVYSGGTLIVSGGPTLLSQVPGPVERFLPGEVLGLDVASVDGMSELPVVATRISSGDVLMESSGIPMVVERTMGNGRVVFLAFDYAELEESSPDVSRTLWSNILGGPSRRDPVPVHLQRRIFETPVLADLLDLPLYEFPPLGIVAALVVAYVSTIVMIFARSGGRYRLSLLPLSLAVSIAFGIGTHLWLNRAQQPAAALLMEYDEIISRPGKPVARLTKDLIVFSTQRQRYEVTLPGGTAVPLQDRDLTVEQGDGITIEDIDVGRWSLRNYHIVDLVNLAVDVRAERRGDELQVLARNMSRAPLSTAVFIFRGQVVPLGTIAPRHSTSTEFVPVSDPEEPVVPDGSLQERARGRIIAIEARKQLSGDSSYATFLAFLPESPLPAATDRPFARRFSVTTVRQEVEVGG